MDFPDIGLEPYQIVLIIFLIPVILMTYFMYSGVQAGQVIQSQSVLMLMGGVGTILMLCAPVYCIAHIIDGDYLQGFLWGSIMFIVGFGLVITWIYP